MKSDIIKQLHNLGVYRDPLTKQKLECMKLADILLVLSYVQEEMEKGIEFKKFEWEYEMVKSVVKKDKTVNKGKKKK
jgi:hypothetical protein